MDFAGAAEKVVTVQIHAVGILTRTGGEPGGVEGRANQPVVIIGEKSIPQEFEQSKWSCGFVTVDSRREIHARACSGFLPNDKTPRVQF